MKGRPTDKPYGEPSILAADAGWELYFSDSFIQSLSSFSLSSEDMQLNTVSKGRLNSINQSINQSINW